ncbi:DUF4913 domain-containing protein [Plantibacter auratus]|uniref:DUF4913 domain-containing protein n=1 Tax=Plantibacter auratus TaxID=272914 RepID=UPI003D3279B1
MLSEHLPLTDVPAGLPEFVDGVLLARLTTLGKNEVWCASWREHPDAVHRLAAIQDEWQRMIAGEDAELHTFIRDVLDYHLPRLVARHDGGVFAGCEFKHIEPARLDSVRQPG